MILSHTFELSIILDTDHFQGVFTRAFEKGDLRELDDEYLDSSLVEKGITVIYRDSRYKKKVRVLINAGMVVDDPSNTGKLLRKLGKRIEEYFDHRYTLDDFTLSGATLTVDIDVGSRANVTDYLKVLKRVGKVKGFSPVDYEFLDGVDNLCLSGNSNNIDFLLYDLERAVIGQLRSADVGRKKIESVSIQTKGILEPV